MPATGKKKKRNKMKKPRKTWRTSLGDKEGMCNSLYTNSSLCRLVVNKMTDLWNVTVNWLLMDLLIYNQGMLLDQRNLARKWLKTCFTPLRNSEAMRPIVLTPGMLHPRMVCLWSRREKLWFPHSQPYSSAQVPALIWLHFCSSEMVHWAAKLCWGLFKRLLSDKKVSREESCKASLAQRRMRMTKIRLWSLGDENSTYMCFILPDVLLRV